MVKLAHEIQERQNISWKINYIFKDDYITPITDDGLKKKKSITIKRFEIFDGTSHERDGRQGQSSSCDGDFEK